MSPTGRSRRSDTLEQRQSFECAHTLCLPPLVLVHCTTSTIWFAPTAPVSRFQSFVRIMLAVVTWLHEYLSESIFLHICIRLKACLATRMPGQLAHTPAWARRSLIFAHAFVRCHMEKTCRICGSRLALQQAWHAGVIPCLRVRCPLIGSP